MRLSVQGRNQKLLYCNRPIFVLTSHESSPKNWLAFLRFSDCKNSSRKEPYKSVNEQSSGAKSGQYHWY